MVVDGSVCVCVLLRREFIQCRSVRFLCELKCAVLWREKNRKDSSGRVKMDWLVNIVEEPAVFLPVQISIGYGPGKVLILPPALH